MNKKVHKVKRVRSSPNSKIRRKDRVLKKEESSISPIQDRKIKVIGIGGIGSSLVNFLGRFLWVQNVKGLNITLDLIDGDQIELRNKERMDFESIHLSDNKAVAKAIQLAREFGDRLLIRPIPEYISDQNIKGLVQNQDIVFLAVDNFKTRKYVSDYCETLKNVVLFSGGNDGIENGEDGTLGNVQIYERYRGKEKRNPITRFHPEINNPKDKAPFEKSCEELAQGSAPQLLFINLAVASTLLNAFYSWLQNRLDYEEAYIDIVAGRVQTADRGLVGRRK